MPRELGAVTVIGGGIIGCFAAYRLAREGVSVTLVERDSPGAGASGTSAGNVMAWSDENGGIRPELGVESLGLFRRFLPDIKQSSGIAIRDQDVNYLFAAMDDEEASRVRAYADPLIKAGLDLKWIDGVEARAIEPRLSPAVIGGILHRDCIQIDAQPFVSALAEAAKARGAKIVTDEVVELQRHGDRVSGVNLRSGSDISCDTVIMAMGAWMGRIASEWLRTRIPVWPHSLQKLHLRIKGEPLRCAVSWAEVNMVLRKDGFMHTGSKHDPVGFEARPTEDGKKWILERVDTVLPGLDYEVAGAWAACASQTPDRMPIVGPVGPLDGVYMIGVSNDGFVLSAILTDILTDLLVWGKEHRHLASLLPR